MVKEQGLSFTLAMVYAVCNCANKIEAFRYRFVDGQIALFDRIDTAFTYLNKDTELFKVVNVPMVDNATPLFDWGKYYEKDGKIIIPISVQAHHSFVDGLHIGQFVEELQKYFNEW